MISAAMEESDGGYRANAEFAIRRLIENWVVWRDSGEFDRFATLWHPDGKMIATWCQASASEFISRSRSAFESGVRVLHELGGSSIDVAGNRAVAQTKMRILVRGEVHGATVDVTCHGRFYDFLETLNDQWLLHLRQPIYELDMMVPTEPGRRVELDQSILARFPEGYRHLAYLQTQAGIEVKRDLPETRGPVVKALMKHGQEWLAGMPGIESSS